MQGKVEALRCKIMAEIKNGTLPVNAKIPSRNQLVRKYGFSRSTVDRTISMLTAEGSEENAEAGLLSCHPPTAESANSSSPAMMNTTSAIV